MKQNTDLIVTKPTRPTLTTALATVGAMATAPPAFTPGVSQQAKKTSTYTPISEQIRAASRKTNRRAMVAGCALGAFVPTAVYLLSHSEPIRDAGGVIPATLVYPYLVVLIIGGLIFSATSVTRWGYQAFGQSWTKAIGFVILVEGTLILSPIQWLSLGALLYLVTINALATGTTLALDKKRHFQMKRQNGQLKQVEVVKTAKKPPAAKKVATTKPKATIKKRAPRSRKIADQAIVLEQEKADTMAALVSEVSEVTVIPPETETPKLPTRNVRARRKPQAAPTAASAAE